MKRCYKKLRGRLTELDMSYKELASAIAKCEWYIAERMRGAAAWTLADCYAVLDAVGAKPDQIGEYFPKEAI